MTKQLIFIILISFLSIPTFGQLINLPSDSISDNKFSISIPYLNLTNNNAYLALHNEIHLGFRFNRKNQIGIKLVSWNLVAPLGIPLGPFLAKASENYNGRLKEVGVGLFYQRFFGKRDRLYSALEAVPLKKTYLDQVGMKIDDGFRMYTSLHVGYYIPLFKNRLFIQPQIHCNYWPINTDSPLGFSEQDEKWNNNYFLFEPNLYFGVNF